MTLPPDLTPDAALLRAALLDHLEHTMTITDTESALGRFRAGVARRQTRRRVLAVAAACAALLGAGAGTLLLLRDDRVPTLPAFAGGSASGLTGSMLLEVRNVYGTDSPVTRQEEFREVSLKGPLTLRTASGSRTGTVDFTNNGGGVTSAVGSTVLHSWGAGTVTLEDTTCHGSWGFSFYRDPSEGGGSIHLACDDGSVLGATLIADDIAPQDLTGIYQMDLRLEDGFFIEG